MAGINVAGDRRYDDVQHVLGVAAANSSDMKFMVLKFDVPDGPPIVVELCQARIAELDEVLGYAKAEREGR